MSQQASERFNRMAHDFDTEFPALPVAAPVTASASSSSSDPSTVPADPRASDGQSEEAEESTRRLDLTSLFARFTNAAPSHESNASNEQTGSATSQSAPMNESSSNDQTHSSAYAFALDRIVDRLSQAQSALQSPHDSAMRNELFIYISMLNTERDRLHQRQNDPDASPPPSLDDIFFPSFERIFENMKPRSNVAGSSDGLTDLLAAINKTELSRLDLQWDRMAAFLYTMEPSNNGSDVWPDIRDGAKLPAKITPVRPKSTANTTVKAIETTKRRKVEELEAEQDSTRIVWPKGALPAELYHLIAEYLSRDDIKAMRKTCKEFEHQLSYLMFKSVVVPFNTEIWGMMQSTPFVKVELDRKGKGKAKGMKFWKNSKEEDIYTGHGVDVFRSFGERIKQFGMSFEVSEDVLINPPLKGTREDHKSYWGVYQWPYPDYQRFGQVAGLEDAADETPKMQTAFSFLKDVEELALSLDSGLGWLCGPDRSLRTKILGEQRTVFGSRWPVPDRRQESANWLWDYLKQWSAQTGVDLKSLTTQAHILTHSKIECEKYRQELTEIEASQTAYFDLSSLCETMAKSRPPSGHGIDNFPAVASKSNEAKSDSGGNAASSHLNHGFQAGVLLFKEDAITSESFDNYPIIPSELSKLQKEWLMETEWAQRAFLSSWLIAIVDNQHTFSNVHTLNLSRISSRFLLSLSRNDFWNSLPSLKSVVLHPIPDCRDVSKDGAGFVETPRVAPITAVWTLQRLLVEMIAPRPNIQSLDIGWIGGGEHASGLLARNKQLMPAPILPSDWLISADTLTNLALLRAGMLKFQYLKTLTLTNCWISPSGLTHLVQSHTNLEHLALVSVSLIVDPMAGPVLNNQQMPAMVNGPVWGAPPLQQGQQAVGVNNNNPAFLHAINNINNLAAATGQQLPNNLPALLIHNNNVPLITTHPINQPPPNDPNAGWLTPRQGSWPDILDTISPGVTLAAAGRTDCPANIPSSTDSTRPHRLRLLTLRSCGYARLNNIRLDESAIPLAVYNGGTQYFSRRFAALSKVMMVVKHGIFADIVPMIPRLEELALTAGFGLDLGWPEEWRSEIEAPIYDAMTPGGTGRFGGVLDLASRVVAMEDD